MTEELPDLEQRAMEMLEAELGERPWAAYSIINHHRDAAIRAITKALASSSVPSQEDGPTCEKCGGTGLLLVGGAMPAAVRCYCSQEDGRA